MTTTGKLEPVRPAWFWSEHWQQMEREVDEHVARGEVKRLEGADEFISFLDGIEPDA